jgi:hypothetical protein
MLLKVFLWLLIELLLNLLGKNANNHYLVKTDEQQQYKFKHDLKSK